MDCAICHDAITKSTGKIELSCSHTFHINCLTTWFKSQSEQYIDQSCPCCRHEATEDEEVPIVETTEHARFKDMLKTYEEQVTLWYISANNAVTKYSNTVDVLKEQLTASKVLIDSYKNEAEKYRLIVEAAKLKEIMNAKKMSVANWAQWSSAVRQV